MIIERLSNHYGLSAFFLTRLARRASHLYKRYTIPKKSGGQRIIYHPARQLKSIQRILLSEHIQNWPVHDCATAYKKGASIKRNAEIHRHNRYVLKMDFKDFFPSISEGDIKGYFDFHKLDLLTGWTKSDISFFTRIVTRNGQLTIGAPTSPSLSNALCFQLDTQIHAYCSNCAITYSRYADDLVFSTNVSNVLGGVPEVLISILSDIPFPSELAVNTRKTLHCSKKTRRQITGVVITQDSELSTGRYFKRKTKSLIHNFDSLPDTEKQVVKGCISHIKNIEPEYFGRLISKYGKEKIYKILKFV